MNTTTKVLGGFFFGTVVGAAVSLLFAPHNGNQNRKLLKRKSKKYSRQAMETIASYIMSVKQGYRNGVGRISTHDHQLELSRRKKLK